MASERKRICWITPDYFLAVDAPLIPRLSDWYDVDWVVINAHGGTLHGLTEGLSSRLVGGVAIGFAEISTA